MNRASRAPRSKNVFSKVVEGIRNQEDDSIQLFLGTFREGVRHLIEQSGSGETQTLVENCLHAVIAAIQRGDLADAAQLPEFVSRTVRHQTERSGSV